MKKIIHPLLSISLIGSCYNTQAQLVPVKPTHIVIVVEENQSCPDVIGVGPCFTALSIAANTAYFTNDNSDGSYPGEPNALEYFSGSIQGVTSDLNGPAPGAPFNDCNMASSLIQNGYTWIGYAEEQPRLGWISYDTLEYITHHIPWINWVGYNTNPDTIPSKCVVPYSHIAPYTTGPTFPDSLGYDSLPTVSIIVPDGDDDMHNGSVAQGDTWFNTNIMPYVRWCNVATNNSIMIVFWEDGGSTAPNVPLLVSGAMVQGGTYTDSLDHYDLLKTIEDMYGLSECANSDSTDGGTDWPKAMWKVSGINSISAVTGSINTWPVPAKTELNIDVNSLYSDNAVITLYDITGRTVKELPEALTSGQNYLTINTSGISNGVYLLTIKGEKTNVSRKIEILN